MQELERLIDLHYLDPDAQRESGLTITDHRLLLGALQYKHKTCACWLRMHGNAVVPFMHMTANPLDASDIVYHCQQSARDHDAAGGCVHARKEPAPELPDDACDLQVRYRCAGKWPRCIPHCCVASLESCDHSITQGFGLAGYTRVPVYEGESRQNIVGILYRCIHAESMLSQASTHDVLHASVANLLEARHDSLMPFCRTCSKDLILVDPDDEIEIAAVLSLRCAC